MEPLAPHEKLYVDDEFIEEDEDHGEIGCETCHNGNPDDPDWKTAHEGVVKDPSFPAAKACIDCHENEAENYSKNLHVNNRPIRQMVLARAGKQPAAAHAKIESAVQGHCTECHSSCGQCHISRPASVKGGLLSGHVFQKSPPMEEVCTACHGSRVGNEYLGKNKQCKADVHYEKGMMKCIKCHTADQMHGDGSKGADRYEVANGPQCLDCHEDIYGEKGENIEQHKTHKDLASCYVCHAQAYTNCYSCHVSKTKEGQKYFETESHSLAFKIGLNYRKSERYPDKYITVRHVPVDSGTFRSYLKDGLRNFDKLPTWKMATPHNIQRKTPQNSACNNCHANNDLFLLETNVRTNYLKANRSVIVSEDQIPKKIEE